MDAPVQVHAVGARPYDNADPLEAALLLAQTSHIHGPEGFSLALDAITTAAAEIVGAPDYGLESGNAADLVVVDAHDEEAALLSRPDRLWVLKRGRLVASSSRVTHVASPAHR